MNSRDAISRHLLDPFTHYSESFAATEVLGIVPKYRTRLHMVVDSDENDHHVDTQLIPRLQESIWNFTELRRLRAITTAGINKI